MMIYDLHVVCAGPLPTSETTLTCSYNLRAAKIISLLHSEGMRCCVTAVDLFNSPREWYGRDHPSLVGEYRLIASDEEAIASLREIFESRQARAVLAISAGAAATACRANPAVPVWADMPGWIMPEVQLKAALDGDDAVIARAAEMEAAVLNRADKISVVSDNQRHATLGELALLKRLNSETVEYEFVHRLPSLAMNWRPLLQSDDQHNLKQESDVPQDAKVLLWSGSYNVWMDVDLLFGLTEQLIQQIPNLHFVSTGGRIPGFNETIYDRFKSLADASPYRQHYHILPWQNFKRVIYWFEQADIGLCINGRNLEIQYGSRTRIVDMLAHGLPVATTVTTELTRDLDRAGVIMGLPPDDPAKWAEQITEALSSDERMRSLTKAGRDYIEREYGLRDACAEMIQWLKNPSFAPDYQCRRDNFLELNNAALHTGNGMQDRVTEPILVTWISQAQIEAAGRRHLDPFPPGRMSRAMQSILKFSLRSSLTRLPIVAAWQLSGLFPINGGDLPRWQSRMEQWMHEGGGSSLDKRLLEKSGRRIYGDMLKRPAPKVQKKATNALLARYDYDRPDQLMCVPQNIQVEPSSYCNIKCSMCSLTHTDWPRVLLKRNVFDRLIPWLPYVYTLQFIGRGEPALNPDLPWFIEAGARQGCWMTLFSNFVNVTPDLARHFVRFSVGNMACTLPGGNAEDYKSVTDSGAFDKVVNNIRAMQRIKRASGTPLPRLTINCPLIRSTLHHAPDVVRLATKLEADAVMLTVALIMHDHLEPESLLNTDAEEVTAMLKECGKIGHDLGIKVYLPEIKLNSGDVNNRPNQFGCLIPWQSLLVRANGSVEVCEYNRKTVGDLKDQGLEQIWNGEVYRQFRKGEVRDRERDHCESCFYRAIQHRTVSRKTHINPNFCHHSY